MHNEYSLTDVLIKCAQAGHALMHPVSADTALMPGGRNGPYLDLEGPMRNTAHWALTFAVAFRLSGEAKYKVAAEKLVRYLLHSRDYIYNDQYVHRQKSPKDWCNGVIGQAWIAEGLWHAGTVLESPEAREKASALLKAIPFDRDVGAWRRMDPVQGALGPDYTYNHQSWFAAAAAEVGLDDVQLTTHAQDFLDISEKSSFAVEPDGLIKHSMQNRPPRWRNISIHRVFRRLVATGVPKSQQHIDPVERAIGYQTYVLHSLSRLKLSFPDHVLWRSDKIAKALDYTGSDSFLDALEDNHYAYPYNAPGFELPLIAHAFGDQKPELHRVAEVALGRQIERTWCDETQMFTLGTYDPVTLAARVYELALALLLNKPL